MYPVGRRRRVSAGLDHRGLQMDPTTLALVVSLAAVAVSIVAVGITAHSTRFARTSADLTFNIQVNQYLDSVALAIAAKPAAHAYVWDRGRDKFVDDNGVSHILTQSFICALSVAVEAADCPPGFSRTRPDWDSYVMYVFENSPAVRHEVEVHAAWWPVLHKRLVAYRVAAITTTSRVAEDGGSAAS
jgi:hypothetical protein